MATANELTLEENDSVPAKEGKVYAVYLPLGGTAALDLGKSRAMRGPGKHSLGRPARDANKDWAVVVAGNGFTSIAQSALRRQ